MIENSHPLLQMPPRDRKKRHEAGILQQRLRRNVGQAIEDYKMIADGDNVMVCVSGGKDSYGLLDILFQLQKRAPISFNLIAVVMDQGHPGFDANILITHFQQLGVHYRVFKQDTYSTVKRIIPEGKTTCSLCSRLRRGALYRIAEEEKADKIALGHHANDIIETFFLNLFYGGSIKTMPPRLKSDNGKHIVIRPLAYCEEKDLTAYATNRNFPIIPCNLCGSNGMNKRQQVKQMIAQWQRQNPSWFNNIFHAMGNIAPSQMMDRQLYDFCQHQILTQ